MCENKRIGQKLKIGPIFQHSPTQKGFTPHKDWPFDVKDAFMSNDLVKGHNKKGTILEGVKHKAKFVMNQTYVDHGIWMGGRVLMPTPQ